MYVHPSKHKIFSINGFLLPSVKIPWRFHLNENIPPYVCLKKTTLSSFRNRYSKEGTAPPDLGTAVQTAEPDASVSGNNFPTLTPSGTVRDRLTNSKKSIRNFTASEIPQAREWLYQNPPASGNTKQL
jgi:hypothetical protein